MTWLITAKQTLSVARAAGLGERELELSGIAVLTFNKAILDRLEELWAGRDEVGWTAAPSLCSC